MIFGIHPVAFWIAAGIGAALALTPLIFLALQATGKLSPELRGDLFLRDHQAVFGGNRVNRGEVGRRIEPALFLRAGWRTCNEQDDGG